MATPLQCTVFWLLALCCTRAAAEHRILWLEEQASFTTICSTTVENPEGVSLYKRFYEKDEVFYQYWQNGKVTLGEKYKGRTTKEGPMNNLKITISNLTDDDSGVYWCVFYKMNDLKELNRTEGQVSTLVVMNGKVRECPPEPAVMTPKLQLIACISAGCVILLCIVVLLMVLTPKVKKYRNSRRRVRSKDLIYEDMRSQNCIRNKDGSKSKETRDS